MGIRLFLEALKKDFFRLILFSVLGAKLRSEKVRLHEIRQCRFARKYPAIARRILAGALL